MHGTISGTIHPTPATNTPSSQPDASDHRAARWCRRIGYETPAAPVIVPLPPASSIVLPGEELPTTLPWNTAVGFTTTRSGSPFPNRTASTPPDIVPLFLTVPEPPPRNTPKLLPEMVPCAALVTEPPASKSTPVVPVAVTWPLFCRLPAPPEMKTPVQPP